MYAYGVLLCEVLTRRPVWEGLRHPQIIHAIAVQKKHPELPESAPKPYRVDTSSLSPFECPCNIPFAHTKSELKSTFLKQRSHIVSHANIVTMQLLSSISSNEVIYV